MFTLLIKRGRNFILTFKRRRIPTADKMQISRPITILETNHEIFPESQKTRKENITKALSANGSSIAPNLDETLNFLAKNPSKKSDSAAHTNTQNAAVKRLSLMRKNNNKGLNNRKKDKLSGIYFIIFSFRHSDNSIENLIPLALSCSTIPCEFRIFTQSDEIEYKLLNVWEPNLASKNLNVFFGLSV